MHSSQLQFSMLILDSSVYRKSNDILMFEKNNVLINKKKKRFQKILVTLQWHKRSLRLRCYPFEFELYNVRYLSNLRL